MLVVSSTQHPTEVQHLVARAIGRRVHEVTVHCRRMGGMSKNASRGLAIEPRAGIAPRSDG